MKYWLFLSLFLIGSCASNEEEEITVPEDLSSHLSGEGILLQGFYWDVEPRHGWWRHLEEKLEEWQDLGVNRLWLQRHVWRL
jgi:hypothetical protein